MHFDEFDEQEKQKLVSLLVRAGRWIASADDTGQHEREGLEEKALSNALRILGRRGDLAPFVRQSCRQADDVIRKTFKETKEYDATFLNDLTSDLEMFKKIMPRLCLRQYAFAVSFVARRVATADRENPHDDIHDSDETPETKTSPLIQIWNRFFRREEMLALNISPDEDAALRELIKVLKKAIEKPR